MKKLPLRPYHGVIWLCATRAELHAAYKKILKKPFPHPEQAKGGQYIKVEFDDPIDTIWLVWANEHAYLAHEFSHILLQTFGTIGHNPTVGDGEPFCYMLSQLLLEA